MATPILFVPGQSYSLFNIRAYSLWVYQISWMLLCFNLLPVYPLHIIICISTLRRRVRAWWLVAGMVCLGFVMALVSNPFYRIAPEDTLAYRDFVELQSEAAHQLAAQHRGSRLLTAWPASDELTRPYLGYVETPLNVAPPLQNFSAGEIASAASRQDYDVALVFATKYQPAGRNPLDAIVWWRRAHERWFDFHEDLTPEAAAAEMHARVVWSAHRGAFWTAILQPGPSQQ